MIDLRSDTVTRPSGAMRQAMAAAVVGDDVYGDDPTVGELEARTAELLGKEAAMFVPSGTMSNQIAVRIQAEAGDLVLIEGSSHLVANEAGGAAAISGVTFRPLPGERGIFTPDGVTEAVGIRHPFKPSTLSPPPRLLCLENTHNAGGGTVWPLEAMRAVCAEGRRHGLGLHLDGARLWHASAASGIPEREYAEPFDTVNVCFSKGLGAPVGSALAGGGASIARARRFRQQLGGGLRQAGVLAAAALYAIEHHRPDLARDVENARRLAAGLASLDGIELDPDVVHSNIVRFQLTEGDAGGFVERCHEGGVHMLPGGPRSVRAVLHRDVNRQDVERAIEIVAGALPAVVAGR